MSLAQLENWLLKHGDELVGRDNIYVYIYSILIYITTFVYYHLLDVSSYYKTSYNLLGYRRSCLL